ncbi:MAG: AraC family transcriptional regulator [Thermoanaerobaculia bacterium]|nr:AraC family transcriptional regulator [Thermoanaerobaculia bacterium]
MPSAHRSRRGPTAPLDALDALLGAAGFALDLLDSLPDVVFFSKDAEGRYRAANDTLARRLGKRAKRDLLGRTARDLFPAPLGERYLEQDLAVCRSGRPIEDLLELHLYPNGREGWCLTTKLPLRDGAGRIVGLAGTSRDVRPPDLLDGAVEGLAGVLEELHARPGAPHQVEELARRAGLSPARFSRRIRALFGVSAAQLVVKVRIDAARRMLLDRQVPIARIALACGYCDQSAFTRQFKAVTGLTPAQYRGSP